MNTARKTIVFGFSIAVLLAAAYVVRHALVLIYINCIFAVVLSPEISGLSNCSLGSWHPSRGSALAILGFLAVARSFRFPFLLSPRSLRKFSNSSSNFQNCSPV
jgi:hypothetical protein